MINKLKEHIWIEIVLIFFWCVFLTNADSYVGPYFLMGMLGICFIFRRTKSFFDDQESRKKKIVTSIYVIALAAAVVLANYNFFVGFSNGKFDICKKIFEAVLILGSGAILFREILKGIIHVSPIKADEKPLKHEKIIFVILWTVLILVYALILFGSQYPGVLTSDSTSQMRQLMTHTYSNHHPYYHTQIIHIMIAIGLRIFGEINKAVAMYSMFSIIVMTACFMYIVGTVYKTTRNCKVTLAIFAFYLIMPYHIIYSMTMWKDVFFGATVTFFAVSSYRCLKAIGKTEINVVVLIVSSIGMCLLRSNGWVAFLLSVIVFAVLLGKGQRKLLLLFLCVLVSTYVLKHPVLDSLQVNQPDTAESLSIPIQQIARVVVDGKKLTEEQEELLSKVVEIEKIPEVYSSYISDPMKNLVRESQNQDYIKNHAFDFAKLYLQLGIRYPHKYIEAWVDQTRGYWNGGYSYWIWATEVYENPLGIQKTVKCQFIDNAFQKYLSLWRPSPFLQVFISIGLYVWGILIASYRMIMNKDKKAFFTTIPFMAVILSLLVATPVFSEFRYAYAIFCGFPFIFAMAFVNEKGC